jgi:hypothetical protein
MLLSAHGAKKMWQKTLFPIGLLLASCSYMPAEMTRESTEHSRQARQETPGEEVARHLNTRYNDVRPDCGQPSQPGFLCNGVIIRGTDYSTAYHSWDNSPTSHEKGAVSFSYLRKDSRYRKLAYGYDNGYIFESYFFANDKLSPEVLCSFPIDAGTNAREGTGCGARPGIPTSGPCQQQGITTAQQWHAHYVAGGYSRAAQCGFDVRDSLNALAGPAFQASIQAMSLIATESFGTQNELRLRVWPDGQGTNLPLEAFFYLQSTPGLSDAQADQKDFKTVTGLVVPVIQVQLPASAGNDALFVYRPGDQVVTP